MSCKLEGPSSDVIGKRQTLAWQERRDQRPIEALAPLYCTSILSSLLSVQRRQLSVSFSFSAHVASTGRTPAWVAPLFRAADGLHSMNSRRDLHGKQALPRPTALTACPSCLTFDPCKSFLLSEPCRRVSCPKKQSLVPQHPHGIGDRSCRAW